MEAALMKLFRIVLIVYWLSVIHGKAVGYVVPQHSQLLLKTNDNNVEVYSNNGSWLQMVLVFSRDPPNSQSTPLIEVTSAGDKSVDGTTKSPEVTITCKDGFIRLESKACYLFSSQQLTWRDALKTCQSMGTTLAHPMNAIENTALVNHLKTNYKGTPAGWYLGGSDLAKEGEWVWAHNKAPIIYTDWIKNQPSNFNNEEHCLHYWNAHDWKWNDTPCNTSMTFICQQ